MADRADAGRARGRRAGAGQVRRRQPERLGGDIAGVVSEAGNVAGLMPHPEHAIDALTGPSADGLGFFGSGRRGAGVIGPVDPGPPEPVVAEPVVQDTVARAAATPDRAQPFAALGLTDGEYAADRRAPRPPARPTPSWPSTRSCGASTAPTSPPASTCGSSRDKAPATDVLLAGIGENAGVVDIGDGYAVTFKIESHNHPSYVEPFQGAATGVGGIVRDILAMGARPVAVMDALRFGPADAPDTRRVLPGVVGGISFYGNCLGPAQHRRRAGLRPVLRGQPAGQRAVRRRPAARGPEAGGGHRPGQPGGPVRRPDRARTASAGPRCWPAPRSGRRRRRRRGREAAQRAGRRPVHGEAADRVLPGALRGGPGASASRTWARPGSRARPPSWRRAAAPACGSAWTRCRCAIRRSARPRS